MKINIYSYLLIFNLFGNVLTCYALSSTAAARDIEKRLYITLLNIPDDFTAGSPPIYFGPVEPLHNSRDTAKYAMIKKLSPFEIIKSAGRVQGIIKESWPKVKLREVRKNILRTLLAEHKQKINSTQKTEKNPSKSQQLKYGY